jgi:hypothetical protein
MRDKLLALCEKLLGFFTMAIGGVAIAYMTFVFVGLWAHLHMYALSGYK